jgi:hypothetical protein
MLISTVMPINLSDNCGNVLVQPENHGLGMPPKKITDIQTAGFTINPQIELNNFLI